MSDKETLDEIVFKSRQVLALKADLDTQNLSAEDRQQQEREILDTLESLGLEDKLAAYCFIIGEIKAKKEYWSELKRKCSDQITKCANSIDSMRGDIQNALIATGNKQVNAGVNTISLTKTKTLEIDYDAIEKQYLPRLIYKPAVLDKVATNKGIQELLNAGIKVDGVQEVEKTSIRIT
jgi:hypothetical protein